MRHCRLDMVVTVNQKWWDESVKRHSSVLYCSDSVFSLYLCVLQRGSLTQIPVVKETRVESGQFLLLSVLCMLFILVAVAVSATFFCVHQRSHLLMKEKLASLGTDTSTDATATYQVRPAPFLWANQRPGHLACSLPLVEHTLWMETVDNPISLWECVCRSVCVCVCAYLSYFMPPALEMVFSCSNTFYHFVMCRSFIYRIFEALCFLRFLIYFSINCILVTCTL